MDIGQTIREGAYSIQRYADVEYATRPAVQWYGIKGPGVMAGEEFAHTLEDARHLCGLAEIDPRD